MARITLEDVHVHFPIFQSGRAKSLLGFMAGGTVGGAVTENRRGVLSVQAVGGVNLSVDDGERLGIIGHNGAGKSTLLRVIAGLVQPTRGRVDVKGERLAILNFAAGMDQQISGRENVEHLGRLFGLSAAERAALTEDVAAFSELGDYFMMPIHTYSSGMKMRLSFGIYTGLARDVLVIDEVLGAGDNRFQAKAAERVNSAINRASIFVLATHSRDTLCDYCTRAILMQGGRIAVDGDPEEVWACYQQSHG